MNERGRSKVMQGEVVSDRMAKTVVVSVTRRFPHPMYKKYVTSTKRYKAHDEKNACSVGDIVEMVETKPLSKDKRWRVRKIIQKAV